MESRRFAANGTEIKPGARLAHPSRLEQSHVLQVVTVMDEVQPDRWHAEVLLLDRLLLKTEQFETDVQAARAAEAAFLDRVTSLFQVN